LICTTSGDSQNSDVAAQYEQDSSVDMGSYIPLAQRLHDDAFIVKSRKGRGETSQQGSPFRGAGCPVSRPSLLDSKIRNLPKPRLWSKKERRAFQRLMSGFRRAQALGEQIRFMTLTSSPKSSFLRLNADFQVFRKRLTRRFGKIKYWKLRTNEGFGVLHILWRGPFLPWRWVRRNWEEIHGAYMCDLRLFRGGSKRLANYLVGNYLCKQTFERMSWSWSWVFKGFVGVWMRDFVLKFSSMKVAIGKWSYFLAHFGYQMKLGG
jgi:hypothetical protein